MPQLAEVMTIKRRRQCVPWDNFAPLLNQAIQATNSSQTQVMETTGYSDSVIAAWRKANEVPLCAKYTILGLLAELRIKVERPIGKEFSFDELTGLFAALQGWSLPDDTRRQLTKKIANAL